MDALFAVVKGHHDLYNGATNPTDKARRDENLQVMCDITDAPTIDAIPVEWLETAIGKFKTAGRTDAVEIVQSLIKAWKSEEELKELLEAQLECMAKQIFAEMDEKGKNAIIEKLGYVPWSDEDDRKKND